MTKEARIYNGEEIVCSINHVGKTRKVHVKGPHWTTLSHHTQI